MSKSITALAVLGFVTLLSACGAAQPEPVAAPEPIVAEPTMGKM